MDLSQQFLHKEVTLLWHFVSEIGVRTLSGWYLFQNALISLDNSIGTFTSPTIHNKWRSSEGVLKPIPCGPTEIHLLDWRFSNYLLNISDTLANLKQTYFLSKLSIYSKVLLIKYLYNRSYYLKICLQIHVSLIY